MTGDYLLPREFLALVVFWFLPPLLIACGIQIHLFSRRGLFKAKMGRSIAILAGTITSSIFFGIALLASPISLPRWLGVTDIYILGLSLPMLPLSFVSVAICSVIFTSWGLHAAKQKFQH